MRGKGGVDGRWRGLRIQGIGLGAQRAVLVDRQHDPAVGARGLLRQDGSGCDEGGSKGAGRVSWAHLRKGHELPTPERPGWFRPRVTASGVQAGREGYSKVTTAISQDPRSRFQLFCATCRRRSWMSALATWPALTRVAGSGQPLRDQLQRRPVSWRQRDLLTPLGALQSRPTPTRAKTIRKLAGQVLEITGCRERSGVFHVGAQSHSYPLLIDLGMCLPTWRTREKVLPGHLDCHRPNP